MCETLKLIDTTFSGNPVGALAHLSKAIEVVHDEKELQENRIVREQLVATIAKERKVNLRTNEALSRILHHIREGGKK